MYLLAGLGNPGSKYAGTRHNIGFMVLDYLAAKNDLSFVDSKCKAVQVRTVLWQEPVILLKPETFMNLSGDAVISLANYYKIEVDRVIVIHDDLDLDLGRIRISAGGGDGGHKGIRSIISCLGSRDFPRIRMGIGRPALPIPPEKYVLSKFDPDELKLLNHQLPLVEEGLQLFIQEGITAAMNVVNPKDRQALKADENGS
jgi:PTH1 family peptidyl-tRNA hydrolase